MLEITKQNLGDVVGAANKLRDKKEAIQREHKAELAPFNTSLQELEGAVLKYMNDNNLQNLTVDEHRGGCHKKVRTSTTVQDPTVFLTHCLGNDLIPLMEIRASAKRIGEFLDDDGDMPPGVKLTRHTQVVFTRGK